jgi:hypothetical protein
MIKKNSNLGKMSGTGTIPSSIRFVFGGVAG